MTVISEGSQLGPYRVVRLLGKGGMGAVYEAMHEAIERKVAIKVLHAEYAADAEFSERFINEARAVNLVDHPGLVQISDYGRLPDETAYIVMEYLKGETLNQRLKRAQYGLPITEVVHLAWQIADALAAAHEKGIVHRDLKPDNIMIMPDRHVPSGERTKLLDFGIAKVADSGGSASARTQVGALMGTPAYMSPEQCAGAGGVDAKSDVYSLGCVLYQMLAGHPPFVGEGAGEVMGMQQFVEPEPLAQVAPATPATLAVLVHQLLAKKRTERPPMSEVVADLDALCAQYPLQGRRTGATDSSKNRLRNADVNAATVSPSGASRPSARSTLGAAGEASAPARGKAWVGLAIGGVIAIGGAIFFLRPHPTPAPSSIPAAQPTMPTPNPAPAPPAVPAVPEKAPAPPPAPARVEAPVVPPVAHPTDSDHGETKAIVPKKTSRKPKAPAAEKPANPTTNHAPEPAHPPIED